MKNFFSNLFSYENFPIYLMVIIVLLLIAFFIVYFLGRKEQKKLENTQRLEAFKKSHNEQKVEVPVQNEPNYGYQNVNNYSNEFTYQNDFNNPMMENQNVSAYNEPSMMTNYNQSAMPSYDNNFVNNTPVMDNMNYNVPVYNQNIQYNNEPVYNNAPSYNDFNNYNEPLINHNANVYSNQTQIKEQNPFDNFISNEDMKKPLWEPSIAPATEPNRPLINNEFEKEVVNYKDPFNDNNALFKQEEEPLINITSDPFNEVNLNRFDELSNSIANELNDLEGKSYNRDYNINQISSSPFASKKEEFVDESFTIELPKLRNDEQNK